MYAFVESDVSELGRITHADIWRMIGSFGLDMGKARPGVGPPATVGSTVVFMRTLVPASVAFLQQYLLTVDAEGELCVWCVCACGGGGSTLALAARRTTCCCCPAAGSLLRLYARVYQFAVVAVLLLLRVLP